MTIEVSGVSRIYKSTGKGVRDVSFQVPSGAVTALVGLNGSGKSTVIGAMLGLVAHDGGVTFDGNNIEDVKADSTSSLGVSFQPTGLPGSLRSQDVLEARLCLSGMDPSLSVSFLDKVGLSGAARVRIRSLSLGMRQRLAVAFATCSMPRYLVLDEPTNGLDYLGRRQALDLIRAVADNGGSVLLSSHVFDDVTSVADDVVVLDDGVVKASGSLDDVVEGCATSRIFVCSSDDLRLRTLIANLGEGIVSCSGDGVLVEGGPSCRSVGELAFSHGIKIFELSVLDKTLSNAFEVLTGHGQKRCESIA